MKHGIQLLLALTLAVAPWGCNRDQSTNDSVSANSDNAVQQNSPEPEKQDLRNQPPAPAPAPVTRAPQTQSRPRQTASRDSGSQTAEVRPTPVERDDNEVRPANRVEREDDQVARLDQPEPVVRNANMATMPAGTTFTVATIDNISTETNTDGDTFTASLIAPLTVGGNVFAEKGAKVQGRIQNVQQPGKVKGKAELELVLTKLTTGGRTYNIDTEPFVATAADNKERDAGIIAGGAGVGAVIGAVAGGKKGAAIGAIIGGGSGTTAVLVTKGEDLKIDPETRVNFVTREDVRLPVLRVASN